MAVAATVWVGAGDVVGGIGDAVAVEVADESGAQAAHSERSITKQAGRIR